jgi:uncharacterized protein (TIGR00255 family)
MGRVMSMTGFGRSYYKGDNLKLVILIKSVNGKGLDITFRMPRELLIYEKELRNQIKRVVHRGQIFVSVTLEFLKLKPSLKVENLTDIVDEILTTSRRLGLSVSDDMIMQLALRFYNPTLNEEETIVETEDFKELFFGTFEVALKDFLRSKLEEGENLLRDIEENLNLLEKYLSEVELKKDQILEEHKRKILQKAKELLGDSEQNKVVANEIKLLFEKLDINEEVKRLKSHIELFREELKKGAPIGKKLEFIAQEMLREVNTMGNKLPDLFPLNIEMKTAIDKIKQQVANIE